ncbi:PepSY domain-containing protein [Streptomyces sp. CAU 1734]|uniref:PepSY domain-containing protein n=1 Tax=Streptomyces sp. CAU 1734 TaxID=3140360 RepID=UPI0032606963
MKRKIVVAAAVTALIVGGGAFTAVAASADDSAPTSKITAQEAVGAALERTPGSVVSVDRDDDGKGQWEIEVVDAKGAGHEVRVDSQSGKVSASVADTDDGDDDGDDRAEDKRDGEALAAAKINAGQASKAALAFTPGTVTDVEFDDGHWDIEIRTDKGDVREIHVDAQTGRTSPSADTDDRNDDRGDRNDSRDDDRDDADDKNDRDDRDDRDDKNDD